MILMSGAGGRGRRCCLRPCPDAVFRASRRNAASLVGTGTETFAEVCTPTRIVLRNTLNALGIARRDASRSGS